tara:strand:- start:270 stop:500 length:231 start_codon:yes stop_codon:yes gene_type:complete
MIDIELKAFDKSYEHYNFVKEEVIYSNSCIKDDFLDFLSDDELRRLARAIKLQNHVEVVSPYQLVVNTLNERLEVA